MNTLPFKSSARRLDRAPSDLLIGIAHQLPRGIVGVVALATRDEASQRILIGVIFSESP